MSGEKVRNHGVHGPIVNFNAEYVYCDAWNRIDYSDYARIYYRIRSDGEHDGSACCGGGAYTAFICAYCRGNNRQIRTAETDYFRHRRLCRVTIDLRLCRKPVAIVRIPPFGRNGRGVFNAVNVRLHCGYYDRRRTRERNGAVQRGDDARCRHRPGVGGYLVHYGMSVPFIVSASLACFSTVLSFFFLPETLGREKQLEARAKTEKREHLFKQMSRALKSPFAFMLILVFVLNFGIMNFESVFGLYVDHKHGFKASDIAFIITAAGLIGVFVQAVGVSYLVRRFGEKRVINVTLIGAAAGLVWCRFAGSYWTVFAAAIFFLTLTSLLRPAVNTMLSKLAGDQQGFAGGMNTSFISLANIAGPSAAGFLFDVNMEFPYMLGAAILAISFLAALGWGKKTQTRPFTQQG